MMKCQNPKCNKLIIDKYVKRKFDGKVFCSEECGIKDYGIIYQEQNA